MQARGVDVLLRKNLLKVSLNDVAARKVSNKEKRDAAQKLLCTTMLTAPLFGPSMMANNTIGMGVSEADFLEVTGYGAALGGGPEPHYDMQEYKPIIRNKTL